MRVCVWVRERERERKRLNMHSKEERNKREVANAAAPKKSEKVNVMHIKHPFVNGVGLTVGGGEGFRIG